ncbi:MAG: hypothetical protein IPN60_18160 [Saprospiraceae bacterium]|nr:hypothetical protein [Candidatus Opimibacter skivensis]
MPMHSLIIRVNHSRFSACIDTTIAIHLDRKYSSIIDTTIPCWIETRVSGLYSLGLIDNFKGSAIII